MNKNVLVMKWSRILSFVLWEMSEISMQTMEHGGVDIVDYVHTMLREQVSLKDIATSFEVTRPQQLTGIGTKF